MDLLIVELLPPELLAWLEARHALRYEPQIALDPRRLRAGLGEARALIAPTSLTVDAQLLQQAPRLLALGRLEPGAANIDLDACAAAGVEVVQCAGASAPAEAEFMLQALLSLLRRFPVAGPAGQAAGRELWACTVGLVGMVPAAHYLAQMLGGFETRLVGYDPALHASDPVWERWRVEPMALCDLLEVSDAVCVQLPSFSRYRGLLGERFLPYCRPGQVMVSISNSELFDEASLAAALASDRIAAAWLDCVAPGMLDPGRPLRGLATLQVSPRVASTTHEAHLRCAWAVARRIDALLRPDPQVETG